MATVIASGSRGKSRKNGGPSKEGSNASRTGRYALMLLSAGVAQPMLAMIYFFEWGQDHTWILENLLVVPIGYALIGVAMLVINFMTMQPCRSGARPLLSGGGVATAFIYILLTLFWGTPLITLTSWDTAIGAGVFDENDPFGLGWNLDDPANDPPPQYRGW